MASSDVNAGDVPGLLATAIISILVSALFYAGRLYSRQLVKQRLDLSDSLLFLGLVCAWVINALILYSSGQGLGQHFKTITENDPNFASVQICLKTLIGIECLYCICMGSIKTSFLVLYRKIFPGEWMGRITHVATIVTITWAIAYFCLSIFVCSPVSAAWDISLFSYCKMRQSIRFLCRSVGASDYNRHSYHMPTTVESMEKLHVGVRSKITLALLFLLGGVNIIASTIRFTTCFLIDWADPTWTISPFAVWTCLELLAAVAGACMPLMRPLCRKIIPASWQLGNTDDANREASDIWYAINSRGRLRRVSLTGSAPTIHTKSINVFAMGALPVQGTDIVGVRESLENQG